jgi:hypothetical protein
MSLLMNFERPTTCRYDMPHVVAYVVADVQGAPVNLGRGGDITTQRAIKHCSLVVELPVGRAEGSIFSPDHFFLVLLASHLHLSASRSVQFVHSRGGTL